MNIHEKYIKRCLQLAQNGLGTTYPNPLVGSVVVYKNQIIGEGWHRAAGEAHAEVNAINSVKDDSVLKEASIYVSLEPCSHYGKTPPCSDLIIDRGIKRVIIGTVDPFAKVAGRGIKKLLDAGCEVQVGILEKECRELNKRFFTFHQKKRPYIILKWAKSEDGFLAPEIQEKREPFWITNTYSKQLVHKWRSEEQAILVGTNTAVADNPQLNTRLCDGSDPVRVVLDKNLRITRDSEIFNGKVKTIVLTEKDLTEEQLKQDREKNLYYEKIDFTGNVLQEVCEVLWKHELQSVIIEGGAQTLRSFIDAGLWDEARVFSGKVQFTKGIKAPEISGNLISETNIREDLLKIYRND